HPQLIPKAIEIIDNKISEFLQIPRLEQKKPKTLAINLNTSATDTGRRKLSSLFKWDFLGSDEMHRMIKVNYKA
ncbi:6091_t:CDS:1, partial [Funneliformis geosporum]